MADEQPGASPPTGRPQTTRSLPGPPPPSPPLLPAVPGYEVLEELGQGGMGVVYRARHLALNRTVALKMMRGGAFALPEELARFRREAPLTVKGEYFLVKDQAGVRLRIQVRVRDDKGEVLLELSADLPPDDKVTR
jgi:hypothetical protein